MAKLKKVKAKKDRQKIFELISEIIDLLSDILELIFD